MTDKIDDGGQAFPYNEKGHDGSHHYSHDGMSLRDWFAGQALAGMAESAGFQGAPWDKLAGDAYEAADAMLRARKIHP